MGARASGDDFEARATERISDLGEDIDVASFAAMFDLFRASARVISDLENTVHRPAGLSTAGFRVLFTVWVFDSLEPREIARLAGVSRAAISGVVNTLERDGFVTRTRQTQDRRLVTVELTDDGRSLLASTYQHQNRRERELFAPLSSAELARFTATLRKLLSA
jgi:DNA-binding MarR family transcriptional regulator